MKRRITSGSTRAPTDWNVPTLQRPDLARLERVQVCLRGLQPRDDRDGVAQEQLARLGQGDRPRPARPLDELLADDPLERRDLLADRGLGVAEPFGRAPERALRGERLERGEVPQLDPEPIIRFHDRNQAVYPFVLIVPAQRTLET